MTRWIEVPYKCACMAKEASIQVEERRPTEEILDFMHRVQVALGADHLKRSPRCRSTTMEYAKIPMGEDVIGRATGGTA